MTSNEAPIILNCPQDVTFVSLPGECGAAISWLEPSVDVDCDVSNTFSFSDDFDPIQATNWSSIEGGAESTFCGSVSGNAFRFTGDDENGGQRLLTTQPLNVTSSGTISFYLLISAGGPDFQQNCDRAEAGEGVELQYSTDGGASWVTITYYGTLEDGPQNTPHLSNFDLKTEVIPDAALSPATQFRLIQPEFSGGGFDVWAIDDFNVTYTAGTSFQQTAGKANGEYVDPGSYDIEYVALNAGGAATTCAFTVTVEDRESPVMDNCPDNITVDADMGSCEAIVSWTDPISTEENCLFDPPLADVLGRYASNLDGVLAVIPNRFVLQYEVNNNNGFRGGGEDTYAYGNLISTSFGSNLEYTQGAIVTSSAFGEEGAYFTSYSNGVWMLVADLDEVSSYRINGNLGTDGDGTANDYSTTFTAVDGTVYYAFFKRVFGTGKPSVNHLILVPFGSSVEQVITDNTNQDLHRISQLATARRIYQFNFYGDRDVDDGYAYTDAEVDVIIEAFVDLVVGTVNLPEITRTAGLANGTSFPVGLTEVTYTATDDAGNTSSCSFNVTVTDNIPPTIFNSTDGSNCTGDLLVELNAAGNLVIPNLINDLVAEDNCGAILSQSPAIGVEIPNLATGDTEVVSITATDYASNTNTESCAVTLTVIAVLPLDLLSFTGEARHKINLLAWTTANEEDFNHFEVERSPDGNAWNFIGEVPRSSPREGPGERAYVFEDEGISAYYRLKMVDLDGTFTYSDV
ncbi:MAG: HYR domain-containing protein, partial [Bacteroidota bacterium]